MKKMKSTFERVMSDLKQKMAFEKEYAEFLQSEILLDVERKKKKMTEMRKILAYGQIKETKVGKERVESRGC